MEPKRPFAAFRFTKPPHLLVVEARFYEDIADLQLKGVKAVLKRCGATSDVVSVPGALEIPAAIAVARQSNRPYEGFIALGCVLKGGTHHDQIVAFESARALQELAVRHALAIGNGILTCNTKKQALERADPKRLNRSGQAAEAALRMIELKRQFGLKEQAKRKL